MARICFVRPPFFKIYGVEKVHFPLSIGYLSSYLEKGGHEVSFVDGEILDYRLRKSILDRGILNAIIFYADPYFMERRFNTVKRIMENSRDSVWDIMIEKIRESHPDIIGISCYTVNMTAVNILSERIKNEIGDVPIVLGGVHPTANPLESLKEVGAADFAVIGEGEESFLELANAISKGTAADSKIDGVLKKGEENFIQRAAIKDLDTIPFPKRNFYDPANYIFGAPLLTSRGCVYRCTFCASHVMWSRKIRTRSVENVIEELKTLKADFDVRRIRILDDTFVLNKRWIKEFCESLKKNNLKFTFNCSGRINTVNEELLAILHDNGFDSIAFGVETGSPRIVKTIKKDIDLNRVTDVITMANKYGFDTTSFYMTGHSGESIEDIRMSEKLFVKSKSKRGELSMLIPYSGTEVSEEAKKKGFKFDISSYYKFYHVRDRVLVNLTKLSDEELLAEHERFERIIRWRNYQTLVKKILRVALHFVKKRFSRDKK